MAKKVYDAVATVGKYTDRNGQEKKRYVNIGAVFESEHGLSMKLETIPVGPEWSGWISFFVPKDKQQEPSQHSIDKGNAFQDQDDGDPF